LSFGVRNSHRSEFVGHTGPDSLGSIAAALLCSALLGLDGLDLSLRAGKDEERKRSLLTKPSARGVLWSDLYSTAVCAPGFLRWMLCGLS